MSNKGDSKKLFANSLLYALSGVLSKGLHFFLLPVYTAFLTTEDYGIVNMVTSFNAVLHYFILLCLDSAIMRFYALYQDDRRKVKRMYGTVIVLVCVMAAIVVATCYVLRPMLLQTVFRDVEFFPYVALGLATLVLDSFSTLHRRMLETRQEGRKVAALGLASVVLSSVLGVIFLGVFHLGPAGMLLSTAIASFIIAVFMLADMVRRDMVTLCFEWELAGFMLRYSLPLVPHEMSNYLATIIGKILLNTSGTMSAVGLYSIATQFASVTDTFQDSVSRAYRPWLNDQLRSPDKLDREKITTISQVLLAGCSIIYLGIACFAQEMLIIMTSVEFQEAWKVIPFLVAVYSIKGILYYYFAQCLFYEKTAKKIFLISITSNLSNIVFSTSFVPKLGMYGNVAASLLSIIIKTTLIYLIDRPNGDIGYRLGTMIRTLLFAWLFMIIGVLPSYFIWPNSFSILNAIYKGAVVCVYLALLWRLHRNRIRQLTGIGDLKGLLSWVRRRRKHG